MKSACIESSTRCDTKVRLHVCRLAVLLFAQVTLATRGLSFPYLTKRACRQRRSLDRLIAQQLPTEGV
jgi:hypothetical protein